MARSRQFATIVYNSQSPSSSSTHGGLAYSTIQWNATPTSRTDESSEAGPSSVGGFYATRERSPSSPHSGPEQSQEPQVYIFVMPDGTTEPGVPISVESGVGPRRAARRRLVREPSEDSTASPSESRQNTRRARSRSRHRPHNGASFSQTRQHTDDSFEQDEHLDREGELQEFSSPSSHARGGRDPPNTHEPLRRLWPFPFSPRIRFPSLSPSPEPLELPEPAEPVPTTKTYKKKKRVSLSDRHKICRMHERNPHMRQQDIAERFLVERSTVSKILREKDRWHNPKNSDKYNIYRNRETKFPRLEIMMKEWLAECTREGKQITDSAIRQKAKSLVPELIATGAFKASAGWIDNFKQRNGIRSGRWEKAPTSTDAESAPSQIPPPPGWNSGIIIYPSSTRDVGLPGYSSDGEGAHTSYAPPVERNAVEVSLDAEQDMETRDETQSHADTSYANAGASMSAARYAQPPVETQGSTVTSSTEATDIEDVDRPRIHPDPYATHPASYEEDPYADYPEAYDEGPGPSVRAAQDVDEAMDTVLAYVTTHNDILNVTERNTLQKIKTLIFDYTANGYVDRTRFPD